MRFDFVFVVFDFCHPQLVFHFFFQKGAPAVRNYLAIQALAAYVRAFDVHVHVRARERFRLLHSTMFFKTCLFCVFDLQITGRSDSEKNVEEAFAFTRSYVCKHELLEPFVLKCKARFKMELADLHKRKPDACTSPNFPN